ncbi:MAG: OsmC family protein [Nitrospirae bacterium]|nr:OsmC family protein [Nitrospirota bacterium]
MSGNREERLREIVSRRIEFFKRKPEAAIYRPKVSSRLIEGLYTETRVREHTVKADYAEAAGGTNRAPNPIELLLSALAACIESAVYEFAAYEGIRIKAVEAEVEGELDLRGLFMVDDSVSPGFKHVSYTLKIRSSDDPDRVKELAQRVIAHCPVVDSLIRPVTLNGNIIVEEGV